MGENVFPCAECGESHYELDLNWEKTSYELPYCRKCMIKRIYSKDDFITDIHWLGSYGIAEKEAKEFIFGLLDNGKRIGLLCSPKVRGDTNGRRNTRRSIKPKIPCSNRKGRNRKCPNHKRKKS